MARFFSPELAALPIVLVVMGAVCPPASAQPPRTVVAIHGGPSYFPGTETLDRAIRDVLQASPTVTVNYFAEYLESEELTLETASKALRDSIRLKFVDRRIDVFIADTVPALEFTLGLRDELYPGVPIVFVAATVPNAVTYRAAAHVTGVVRSFAMSETLELALTLHPSVTQVFVVAYAPGVRGYAERVRSTLSHFARRVQLTYLEEPTVEAMLAAVSRLPPHSLILYTRYSPMGGPRVVYPDELVADVAEAASVPVYAGVDIYLGHGVVGGMIQKNGASGARVGGMTRLILEGARAEDIPIESAALVPIFDWRQITRWSIDVSKLPPGSQIVFRTPTFWETYRSYVVATIVVITAQLLLIAGLLTQRARRRHAEEAVRAREASLRTSYDRIRQLGGRLIHAEEAARASIAKDLHDDVCQRLTSVSLAVESLRISSGDIQAPDRQEALAELAADTRDTVEGIRRLSHDLHPVTLRFDGLAPALNAHCIDVAKRQNVRLDFRTEGDLEDMRADVAVCLYRIAQEALRNALVHGHARRLAVSVVRSGADVELSVTDDGCGFDVEAVRQQSTGLGLVSMEERAHLVRGHFQLLSEPRQGTAIRVRVPAHGA